MRNGSTWNIETILQDLRYKDIHKPDSWQRIAPLLEPDCIASVFAPQYMFGRQVLVQELFDVSKCAQMPEGATDGDVFSIEYTGRHIHYRVKTPSYVEQLSDAELLCLRLRPRDGLPSPSLRIRSVKNWAALNVTRRPASEAP